MVVLEKRLNKGWKEKSASNSTSGSKMYVCMYTSKRYCLMPVIGDVMDVMEKEKN